MSAPFWHKWGSVLSWGRKPEGERRIDSEVLCKDGSYQPTDATERANKRPVSIDLEAVARVAETVGASEAWWAEYRTMARPKQVAGYPEKIAAALRRLYPTVEDFLGNAVDRSDVSQDYWLGLLIWVEDTPRVTYRGQRDKARHFAYGAWAEASASMGYKVGRWKEMLDKYFLTGQADPADEQATRDGADAVKGTR